MSHRTVGISLRFRPHSNPADWQHVLEALWAWEPALRPQVVQLLVGPGSDRRGELPWDPQRLDQLARTCADTMQFSWIIGGAPGHVSYCEGREGRVALDLLLPVTHSPAVDRYVALIAGLPVALQPTLTMAYDADRDLEVPEQGLRGLSLTPPVIVFGARAVDQLGGSARVRGAPCSIIEVGTSIMLVVDADVFRPSPERARAVAEYFQISRDHPLVLHDATRSLAIAAFRDRELEWIGNEILGVIGAAEDLAKVQPTIEPIDDPSRVRPDPTRDITLYTLGAWVVALGPKGLDQHLDELTRVVADRVQTIGVAAIISGDTGRLTAFDGDRQLDRLELAQRFHLSGSMQTDTHSDAILALWRQLGIPEPGASRPALILRFAAPAPWAWHLRR